MVIPWLCSHCRFVSKQRFAEDLTDTIRCSANRLILWNPLQRPAMAASRTASTTVTFAERPVHLLALWGETRAKVRSKDGAFEPSFEGKTDSWGGHYYAQDHDHR